MKRPFGEDYPTISDDDYWEAICLAHASFYKYQNLEEDELNKIFLRGKPITYWIAKLNKED